ncbi:MAG: hypothetical protein GY941_23540 [Planctomycetes bacterium]|nr:hypothetical protein [Planctomycetota bacterium]
MEYLSDIPPDELIKEFGECCYTCDGLSGVEEIIEKESKTWCKSRQVTFLDIMLTKEMKCKSWVKIDHDN